MIEVLQTKVGEVQGGVGCGRHMNIPYDRPGGRHPLGGTGWEQPTARTVGGVLEACGYRQMETGWEHAASRGGEGK